MPGTVKLVKLHTTYEAHFYTDAADRKRVIELWKRRYCWTGFEGFEIRIYPDVDVTKPWSTLKKRSRLVEKTNLKTG